MIKKHLDERGHRGAHPGAGRSTSAASTRRCCSEEVDFSEIYDLSALRVIVNSVGGLLPRAGLVHDLWMPIPERFSDYIAKPKSNMYQSLHTKVIGPQGRAAGDPDPHLGHAPHGGVRRRGALAVQRADARAATSSSASSPGSGSSSSTGRPTARTRASSCTA